jgi:hypothetical protein
MRRSIAGRKGRRTKGCPEARDWTLYAHDGKPVYCYNLYGVEYYYIRGDQELPAGKHQVRAEFAYDGGGLAKGGQVTLYVDGSQVVAGRVEGSMPFLFSLDETVDMGVENGTMVSPEYLACSSKPTTSTPPPRCSR